MGIWAEINACQLPEFNLWIIFWQKLSTTLTNMQQLLNDPQVLNGQLFKLAMQTAKLGASSDKSALGTLFAIWTTVNIHFLTFIK